MNDRTNRIVQTMTVVIGHGQRGNSLTVVDSTLLSAIAVLLT